jgi:hypothetical protein
MFPIGSEGFGLPKRVKFKPINEVKIFFIQQTKMKPTLPTKEQIEENYGYSIHEACTRLNIGINLLKELCRSYDIQRWPKVRKTRNSSDLFQSFSINKTKPCTENKPQILQKQTKTLKTNIEKLHHNIIFSPQQIQDETNIFQMIKPREKLEDKNSKISIFNLCN